jgi:SAM-dependent methyltransferase
VSYVHGYSARETERLKDQSGILKKLLHQGTEFKKGEKILEAGCGVGAQTRLLSLNNPDSMITSIDISRESLQLAEKTINENGIINVTFHQEDLRKMKYPDESFDHIFICFVLEHLDNPPMALNELRRVLKPGGSITLIEGDHGSSFWHPETEAAQLAWKAFISAQANLGHDGLIGRRLYPLLNDAKFLIKDVSPRWVYADYSNPALLNGVVNKIIVPMVKSAEDQILKSQMLSTGTWNKGIQELSTVGLNKEGTFFYTWFKALAYKK